MASALRRATRIRTASLSVVALMTMLSAAHAEDFAAGGCIGSGDSLNCVVRWGEAHDPYVRIVPQPADDTARKQASERDRKWEERCKPTVAQDRYGVPRYQYAAPGCAFGVIQ